MRELKLRKVITCLGFLSWDGKSVLPTCVTLCILSAGYTVCIPQEIIQTTFPSMISCSSVLPQCSSLKTATLDLSSCFQTGTTESEGEGNQIINYAIPCKYLSWVLCITISPLRDPWLVFTSKSSQKDSRPSPLSSNLPFHL